MKYCTSAGIAEINDRVLLELARIKALQVAADELSNYTFEQAMRLGSRMEGHPVEAGAVLLWRSGSDTMCEWVNDSWCRWRGRTRDQELGIGWADGVHKDDIEKLMTQYLAAFQQRAFLCTEFRVKHRSGEYRRLRGIGLPRYENGIFIGYTGMCIDETQRFTLRRSTDNDNPLAHAVSV